MLREGLMELGAQREGEEGQEEGGTEEAETAPETAKGPSWPEEARECLRRRTRRRTMQEGCSSRSACCSRLGKSHDSNITAFVQEGRQE